MDITPVFNINHLLFHQQGPYFLLWQEKFLWECLHTFLQHEFFQLCLEAKDWLEHKIVSGYFSHQTVKDIYM